MGNFRQISTELWPLIYLKVSFPCKFSSNFVQEFILRRSGLGLKMGKFCQISTELWPLIYVKKSFPDSILGIY